VRAATRRCGHAIQTGEASAPFSHVIDDTALKQFHFLLSLTVCLFLFLPHQSSYNIPMAIFVSSGYIRRPPIFFVLETSAVSDGNQGSFVLVDGGECCNWLSFHRKMQFFLIYVITHSSRLQSNRHTHTSVPTAWSTYRTFACQPVSTRAHSDSNQHASFQHYPHTTIMKHIVFYFLFPLTFISDTCILGTTLQTSSRVSTLFSPSSNKNRLCNASHPPLQHIPH
jgi:hypothetical protein